MRVLALLLLSAVTLAGAEAPREFLTAEEIALLQIKQRIDVRTDLYLRAALLRLKSAEARLRGEETEPGDPLEYLTAEDMLDGYYRILHSVMVNLEDAYRPATADLDRVRKALKQLRQRAEESMRRLDSLEALARRRNDGQLLRLIERAREITAGAHEGAREALREKTDAPAG